MLDETRKVHFFAVTIALYNRTDYENDMKLMSECIELLHQHKLETGHIGYEIQTKSPHSLHTHILCASNFVELCTLHKAFKGKASLNIKFLNTKQDVQEWQSYCKKDEKKSLAYIYAETTGLVGDSERNIIRDAMKGARDKLAQCFKRSNENQ